MSSQKTENLWERWENEVEKFTSVSKYNPPETNVRHWQRYLLFIFMQELSKNVLNKKESLHSIIGRVIEAFQIGCGFKRVRIYKVIESDKKEIVLHLYETSKGHDSIEKGLPLATEYGADDAVDTFLNGEPLVVDDAEKLKLIKKKELKTKGPYAAIPLFVGKKPFGLICADTVSPKISSESAHTVNYIEYKEHFDTFARTVIAAIENRIIFEQREHKIKQFELVKEFNELIESETDKEKLLESFMKHCVEMGHADGGHLRLYNEKTKKWERVAEYGEYAAPKNLKDKPSDISFTNLAVKAESAVLIDDLSTHPLMEKNITYCKEKKLDEYLGRLKNRKSALIVPLVKHTGEIYGVLDLHSKHKNQFTEIDKENLMALAGSVTYAVDKAHQLEQRDEFLNMQNKLLTMFKAALGKAHCYECVLGIIRKNCRKLLKGKKIRIVCLAIKDPLTNDLIIPSFKCIKSKKEDCSLCFKETPIIKDALKTGVFQSGNNDFAFPITLKKEVIGILYLQGKQKIFLNDNEKKILDIITSTAAILITTARNYEEKIKQSTAFYEAGQLSTKTRDFKEWFTPVMEKVLDIIGRSNRNFHLVMVEEGNGEKKLIIRGTSPLFIKEKEISVKKNLLGLKLSMDNSLSGEVVKKEKSQIIRNVERNKKRKIHQYYEYNPRIKSEVGIPLKIKEGDTGNVIGVLIIDSVIINDFKNFDLEFYESVANYLGTIIHNQQLYEERARFQEELSRADRAAELNIILNNFFHDIKDPLQEIKSAFSAAKLCDDEAEAKKILDEAEQLSLQLLSITKEFSSNFAKTVSKRETIEVRNLIAHSLETVEKTSGLSIDVQCNFDTFESKINCIPVFIVLAFRAIINNAIKFSKKLERPDKYLKIDTQDDTDNSVTIIFESSTSNPIPEDKLEQIFDPFMRGTTKEPGIGLGLPLAALCIKLHRGEISAENVEDQKTTKAVRFIITIPKGLKVQTGVTK